MADYANPQAIVDIQWVTEHLEDADTRLVLADRHINSAEDPRIPGSVVWRWSEHMQHPGIHDIPDGPMMEDLLGRAGIGNGTTVVLYGGANNWYAAYAFWLLKIYGHQDVRLMQGGIKKWSAAGHATTTAEPEIAVTSYQVKEPDWSTRALSGEVRDALDDDGCMLVDVRSPPEYAGEVFAPQTPVKFGERAGHIPGAVHIPCPLTENEDGTYKTEAELRTLFEGMGVTPDKEAIVYCTIGARSGNTWFVLKHLLGYPKARLYDGSWGEWGNLMGVPIDT